MAGIFSVVSTPGPLQAYALGLFVAAVAVVVLALMATLRRRELERFRHRLTDEHEQLNRCRKQLDDANLKVRAASDANRELRLLLARKEAELGAVTGRPPQPLPNVGMPESSFGVLAETLAVAAERLKAATERIQVATEVRKNAIAKLAAANEALKSSFEKHPMPPPAPKKSVIEIVEEITSEMQFGKRRVVN